MKLWQQKSRSTLAKVGRSWQFRSTRLGVTKAALTSLLAYATIAIVAGSVSAGYEAISYGVCQYQGSAECAFADSTLTNQCGGGNIPSSYDYARIFRCVAENSAGSTCRSFELEDTGETMSITDDEDWDYDSSLLKFDSSVNWRDFADQVRAAEFPRPDLRGGDHLSRMGADWADIVFLSAHGWPMFSGVVNNSGTFPGSCPTGPAATRFRLGMHNSANECHLFTPEMALSGGFADEDRNRDASVFISRACNSANPCVWLRGGYRNMARGNWFLMHNGFYGGHRSAPTDYEKFKGYLTNVRDRGIGSQWLADMNTQMSSRENCPVSIVYCDDTRAEAPSNAPSGWRNEGIDYYNCHRMFYWGGARNLRDTGATEISKMYWIGGCDPDGSGNTNAPLLGSGTEDHNRIE